MDGELQSELLSELRALRRDVNALKGAQAAQERTLTVKEAAEYLQMNPRTLQRWAVNEGRITYLDIGTGDRRMIRFKREHMDEFQERHTLGKVRE